MADGRKSDEVPDLNQLVQISTQPTADADDERETEQYHPKVEAPVVSVGDANEEQQTSLYNPSVASLLSKFTEPEVKALQVEQGEAACDLMGRLSDELRQALEYLRAHQDPDDLHRGEALEGASRRCTEVAERLDDLQPDREEEDAEPTKTARKELVDAFFELKRLVDTCRERDAAVEATAAPRKIPIKPKPSVAPRAAPDAKPAKAAPRSRRAAVLGIIVALLALGRGGLYLRDYLRVSGDSVEQISEPGSVETIKKRVEVTGDEPVVLSVALAREESGAVAADAVVLDPGDCSVHVAYRWFENDSFLSLDESGLLMADKVKAGATYHVEALARCGKASSLPLRSGPLKVSGGGRGEVSK